MPTASIIQPVTAWGDLVACQEKAVEIRQIIEAAGEGDIRHDSFTLGLLI
jgi:hypothetical protein